MELLFLFVLLLFKRPAHYGQSKEGAEKALNYSDDVGRSLGPAPPKWNSLLRRPERHLISQLHSAIQRLVSECLVNITMKTVLSDGFPTSAPCFW